MENLKCRDNESRKFDISQYCHLQSKKIKNKTNDNEKFRSDIIWRKRNHNFSTPHTHTQNKRKNLYV